MTSERADQPAAPERHGGGPGKTLAAQREAMGWSVEQVADQLKLAVRQVVALEADDYASLPSPAVTRGFVRAYAKILKLDAAPLVAQIDMANPPPVEVSTVRREKPATFSESRFPSHGRRSSLPLGWIAAAVVVLAGAGAAWKFGLIPALPHGETATSGVTTVLAPVNGGAGAPASGPAADTLQNPSVPLISVPSPNGASASAAGAAPAAGAAQPATGAEAPGSAATPAGVAGATPPGGTAAPSTAGAATVPAGAATASGVAANAMSPAATPASASGAPLVFTVSEDSWIDVRPAKGGKPLFSGLVKAGSTETVNVSEPVKVVVGNTHGVHATLRGNDVALPGKTARINLQ